VTIFGVVFAGLVMGQVPEVPAAKTIVWAAPQECPDGEALRRAIVLRLGRELAEGFLGAIGATDGAPWVRRFAIE